MKILDTNILNEFIKGNMVLNLSEQFYVTEDLKNEIENVELISSYEHKNKIQKIKFISIENHPYFNEAKYLENYKNFINKYNKIVSFYGLKGLTDISILACIETILNTTNPNLFESYNSIKIITHDRTLKEALIKEFNNKIIINDPMK